MDRNTRVMQEEWAVWRQVCTELDRLSIDINKEERLASALVLWGERLATLRHRQSAETRNGAMSDAHAHYNRARAKATA